MTKLKKLIFIGALAAVIAITSIIAFAATSFGSASEIAAGLTGRTTESVVNERNETGKTYGTIANEAGKLDEFKKEMLEQKKLILNQKIKDGLLTQEEADKIIAAIEEKQASCDGTGSSGSNCLTGNGQGRQMNGLCGNRQGRRGCCGNFGNQDQE
jgi:hypothetical protein